MCFIKYKPTAHAYAHIHLHISFHSSDKDVNALIKSYADAVVDSYKNKIVVAVRLTPALLNTIIDFIKQMAVSCTL